jgi:hypothetical protein
MPTVLSKSSLVAPHLQQCTVEGYRPGETGAVDRVNQTKFAHAS